MGRGAIGGIAVRAAQEDPGQEGQLGQRVRDRPLQVVELDVESVQTGQVEQGRRQGSLQVVDAQVQDDHLAVFDLYALPLADGRVGKPLVLSRPVGAVGGVVEGDQRLPLGQAVVAGANQDAGVPALKGVVRRGAQVGGIELQALQVQGGEALGQWPGQPVFEKRQFPKRPQVAELGGYRTV